MINTDFSLLVCFDDLVTMVGEKLSVSRDESERVVRSVLESAFLLTGDHASATLGRMSLLAESLRQSVKHIGGIDPYAKSNLEVLVGQLFEELQELKRVSPH